MNDEKVSLTRTMAWVTWAVAGLLVALCIVVDWRTRTTTTPGMVLCTFAIIAAAGAATLHTRSFFCALTDRILRVYESGRDRGRLEEMERHEIPLQRVR